MIIDVFKDFFKYLKKHNIVALAVGFMIAKNISTLTKSAVDNIFNPLLDPIVHRLDKNINLKTWKVDYGPFQLNVGKFLSDSIEFILLAVLIVTMSNVAERLF